MRQTTRQREELLRKAALKVFCRKGYHYASIRDIAQEARMQTGSVYYYVNSKEDLLENALTADLEEMTATIEQIANSDLPPEKKLREALNANMCFIADHRDGVGVFMQDWHSLSADRVSKVIAKRDYYENLFRRIVQEGISEGVFREVDVSLITFAIFGMCNYSFVWYSPNGKRSARDIAEAFSDLLLDGLAASIPKEDERRKHRSKLQITRNITALRETLESAYEAQVRALHEIEREL